MGNTIDLLQSTGFLLGCAFALRELLIAVLVIWSMCTDDKGRDHALKVLKVLRVQLRQPPPEVPTQQIPQQHTTPPPQIPPEPTDPPLSGSAGEVAA